jgi:YjbE family integral membrane protein
MDLHWVGIVLAVVLVDLSLSGDNAVVIGAVASRLPPSRQRIAITFGILMAIVARIVLAVSAVLVLRLPYVQAAGGVIVLLIAGQIVVEQVSGSTQEMAEEAEAAGATTKRRGWRSLRGNESLLRASLIILLADVTMSLDNILAIVALAQGIIPILAIGFALSMLLLLVASNVVARLIARFPILMYAAAGILAWTAGTMVLGDQRLHPLIAQLDAQVPGPSLDVLVAPTFVAVLALFTLIVWLLSRRGRSRANAGA